nr:nicotinamide/nicotinic acid mononucleotide adenylyltransferase isoform X1 [Tanacetum cinerariifolium]
MDDLLPTDKLSLDENGSSHSSTVGKMRVVLFQIYASFLFPFLELARDALNSKGFQVVGGYMSPVNDAYKKKGLIPAEHRITMCQLACKSSEFVMVDTWEAKQSSFQRSLTVLSRIRSFFCDNGLIPSAYLKVMLVYGSDLLESFSAPGAWIPQQAKQSSFQRSLTVLSRIQSFFCDNGLIPSGIVFNLLESGMLVLLLFFSDLAIWLGYTGRVMLVCGSDLLESFSTPGAWIPEQVRTICKDYGVVCIRREGQDIDDIIAHDEILTENKSNIEVVDEIVPNRISSTLVRDCISRGLSVNLLQATSTPQQQIPAIPNLPQIPSIPNMPQPQMPIFPNTPQSQMPTIPTLQNMPTIPNMPKVSLPPLPSMPTIPNLPTSIPQIPSFAPPPSKK